MIRAPARIERVLRAIEREIVDGRYETVVVVDRHGDVIVRRTGSRRGVDMTPTELAKLRGTWLTHNHPSNHSLSRPDIDILYAFGCAQVRAVARGGTRIVRYVAEPARGLKIALVRHPGSLYQEWLDDTGKREGQFGPYQHAMMLRLAREGLVKYSRS